MAYNLQKGTVEGSVDQYGDQEIEGVKVFKSVISASVFYDTDAGSPCATENRVAIDTLIGSTNHGILTYESNKRAKTHYNLTFDGDSLRTNSVVAKTFIGSGAGLNHLPARNLTGLVPAASLDYGKGLECYRDTLKVKSSAGISVTGEGVGISLAPNGALGFKNDKLHIAPTQAMDITEKGQNLSDEDLLLVHDTSRNEIRHTTAKNLFEGYLKFKGMHPNGPRHSLQFKGNKEFEGSASLSYEPGSKTLHVQGDIKAIKGEYSRHLQVNGDLEVNGSVYKNIKVVSQKLYDVQDTDHVLLCDTTDGPITAILPPAAENCGRVIVIKNICREEKKYKIKAAYMLKIRTEGELIDFSRELVLKSHYSVRTFHSDGDKWWITNRAGT